MSLAMVDILKSLFFFFLLSGWGFISARKILGIKDLLFLMPTSITLGISSYIFLMHLISFLVGPSNACLISLITLVALTLLAGFIKKCDLSIELNLSKWSLATLIGTSVIISILSFFSIFREGNFDHGFHTNLTLNIFKNNFYPPLDLYRPQYLLHYHYAGDLLAGSIYKLFNVDVQRSFVIISALLSSVIFLSFTAIAWIVTKRFWVSFLAGFCTYFSGGLLWLDALIKYFTDSVPNNAVIEKTFVQTFLQIGVFGSILNPPSIATFISTFNLGYSTLTLAIILTYFLLKTENKKSKVLFHIFLNINLLVLFMSAEWLFLTYVAGALPYAIYCLIKKDKSSFLNIPVIVFFSFLINKTIGTALFMASEIDNLGRSNIFNIAIKEELFTLYSWGGRISDNFLNYTPIKFFSWYTFSEFGLSLIFIPLIIFYIFKQKNKFAVLLLLFAITTMPAPLIFDFKTSLVDLNRLFAFGNCMLVLLGICAIGDLLKNGIFKKTILTLVIFCITLSPIISLIGGAIFTTKIYRGAEFTYAACNYLSRDKSISGIIKNYKAFNGEILKFSKLEKERFEKEVDFLQASSSPGDVAISTVFDIPTKAGVYGLVPGNVHVYKDQMYSSYDSISSTLFITLDPHLLNELKVKWLIVDSNAKSRTTGSFNENINKYFNLAFSNDGIEIFKLREEVVLNEIKHTESSVGWLLVNRKGMPVETNELNIKKLTVFPNMKEALFYLKDLYTEHPNLKKDIITAQPYKIEILSKAVNDNFNDVSLVIK